MNILTVVCFNILYVFMYFVCNNMGYFGKQQFKQPQTTNSPLLSDSQIQMIGLPGCIRAKPMYQRMLFKSLYFQLDLKRCASKLPTTPVETGLFLASKTSILDIAFQVVSGQMSHKAFRYETLVGYLCHPSWNKHETWKLKAREPYRWAEPALPQASSHHLGKSWGFAGESWKWRMTRSVR